MSASIWANDWLLPSFNQYLRKLNPPIIPEFVVVLIPIAQVLVSFSEGSFVCLLGVCLLGICRVLSADVDFLWAHELKEINRQERKKQYRIFFLQKRFDFIHSNVPMGCGIAAFSMVNHQDLWRLMFHTKFFSNSPRNRTICN
jgi:hypothetical protein